MEKVLLEKKRKFRGKDEILALLGQQQQSGISVRAFCKLNQLSESSFNNWVSRHKKESVQPEESFATVHIQPASAGALFAEIGGIKIYQPVSAGFLKELAS